MNPFKDVFKDCDRKFTQSQSRGHNFITQNLFNERLLVAGSLLNRVGCLVTWVTWVHGCVGYVGQNIFYVGHNFYEGCVGQFFLRGLGGSNFLFLFYFILFLRGLAFIY